MANRIAGITVEIGGSTTGLSKALESVNKTIKTVDGNNNQSRGFIGSLGFDYWGLGVVGGYIISHIGGHFNF